VGAAPRALRDAGLVAELSTAGLDVYDAGDLSQQVWAPDRDDPLAQNTAQLVASVQELAERVPETLPLLRRMLRAQPSSRTACPAPWVGRGSSA
jgi:arginase